MRNGQTGNKIWGLIESMYEKEGYCYGCPIKYQANKIVIDLTGENDTTQSLVLYLLHSLVILLKHKKKGGMAPILPAYKQKSDFRAFSA